MGLNWGAPLCPSVLDCLWCSRGCRGALNWAPMMPRGFRLSVGCTSDGCRIARPAFQTSLYTEWKKWHFLTTVIGITVNWHPYRSLFIFENESKHFYHRKQTHIEMCQFTSGTISLPDEAFFGKKHFHQCTSVCKSFRTCRTKFSFWNLVVECNEILCFHIRGPSFGSHHYAY